MQNKRGEMRFRLVNVVAVPCLATLKKLGLRDGIARFIDLLQPEARDGVFVTRPTDVNDMERWAAECVTLLHLAAAYQMLGQHDLAAPILDAARQELLGHHERRLPSKDDVQIARAYVTALGAGAVESGLPRLIELFREMPGNRIPNTWTTAQYYSRSHLNLIEDAVLAVFTPAAEPPHVVSA